MKRDQAHALLSQAQAGCDVSEREILSALRVTGDLSGVAYWRAIQEYDTPSTSAFRLHKHLLETARQTIADAKIGTVDDEYVIDWAETIVRQNQRAAP